MRKQMRRWAMLVLMLCLAMGMKTNSLAATAAPTTGAAGTTRTTTDTTPSVPANFTGVKNLKFYKRGKQIKVKGWVKYKDYYYYFKNNQALTGWEYVRDLSGSSQRYKYYFTKSGRLCQNLFKAFGAQIRKRQMKILVNLTTHNITVMLYNKKTNAYDIPAKTWVCATARDGHSTVPGNYHLSKSSASAWFIYKKSNPYHYYQYKVKIHGTRMLFHSEMYSGTSKSKLVAWTYNGLGTNQTTRCIRSQCGNAYLLYRIAKENKHSIPVKIYRSSNKGPFGKMTLANSGGKISGNQKYDPTDPKYKGYSKVW